MPRAAVRDAIYYKRRYTPEIIELCVRWYVTYRLSYRDISAMMAERDISVSHTTILRRLQRYVPEFERRWARFARPINSSWRVDETSVPVQGRWNYLYRDHRAIKRKCASMLSLKSFRTAAVTFSGVELARRIHKRQFAIAYQRDARPLSLKALWDQALSGANLPITEEKPPFPLTQQNSKPRSRPRGALRRGRRIFLRHPRRVPFGGGLRLLVSPTGGRSWHYRYRFDGRDNLLSLGRYPEVPIENACARHQAARQLLALGVNPADRKKALRQISAVRV